MPLTRLICDVLRRDLGTMTTDDIRNNWRQGHYAGVRPQWAAWYVGGM